MHKVIQTKLGNPQLGPKVTVSVCMTTFESYGSSSESGDDANSNGFGSATLHHLFAMR